MNTSPPSVHPVADPCSALRLNVTSPPSTLENCHASSSSRSTSRGASSPAPTKSPVSGSMTSVKRVSRPPSSRTVAKLVRSR